MSEKKSGGHRNPKSTAKRARYRAENRRERNKARRLVRHLKRQPRDSGAARCLANLYDANPIALRAYRTAVLALNP